MNPKHELMLFHTAFPDAVEWRLEETAGLVVKDTRTPVSDERTVVALSMAINRFAKELAEASVEYQVPVELLIATMMNESGGNPLAKREEPGYVSDAATPSRISFGLCQLLISTARSVMKDKTIDRKWLADPANNLRAAAAYIREQKKVTRFDPPKVACAYNAGGVYQQTGRANRWKMRQFPIGTGKHADRFQSWFNAAWKASRQGAFAGLPCYRFEDYLK